MNKTRIIGDIHGALHEYEYLLTTCEKSIQIGDFGIGFAGKQWHNKVNKIHEDGANRFIRGNHDNPDKCRTDMVGYIEDGTIENDIFYCGGAWTIDSWHRTEGVSIWHNEELTHREFDVLLSTYSIMKPRIVITHDCPSSIAQKMFIDSGKSMFEGGLIKTRTGQALQAMLEIHQPELWVHGHWHSDEDEVINGTRFICLGINSYIDIDLSSKDLTIGKINE